MADSNKSKLGLMVAMAIGGVVLGIGPFSKGHKLMESDSNNDSYYESETDGEDYSNPTFKGSSRTGRCYNNDGCEHFVKSSFHDSECANCGCNILDHHVN